MERKIRRNDYTNSCSFHFQLNKLVELNKEHVMNHFPLRLWDEKLTKMKHNQSFSLPHFYV
ncbi:CLUMA_CG001042, isoform A [Clunio marinus]|uniref:CLUMA_CG001042, isoform A n=1 Tax=Clunio marinus TaxID=568069 RepID=A0A1J1HGV0_9DIPT|nr:CLUMA_CG001042, isoform A [Clunio marinus]